MSKFHWLEKLELGELQVLTACVAELLPSARPEPLLGLRSHSLRPIGVTAGSRRYQVQFHNVGAYKVVPEPYNEVSTSASRLEPFLLREITSSYLEQMEGAMHLANIPNIRDVMHYVIYAENHVVHVLTSSEPTILAIAANGP
jgi:hypothetical protein